jgi:hypothetical protein
MTTQKVAVLQVKSGIQRDGTEFAAPSYRDGQWVRFQYGRPRKMGGYSGAFLNSPGISRGMILQSQNGITYVISGYSNSVQRWAIANDQAIGTGPQQIYVIGSITTSSITTAGAGYTNGTYTGISPVTTSGNGTGATFTVVVSTNKVTSITATANGTGYGYGDTFTFLTSAIGGGSPTTTFLGTINSVTYYGVNLAPSSNYYQSNANTLWQWDIGYDPYGSGNLNLIGHPGINLTNIDNTVNTRPLVGSLLGTTLTPVGVFTATGTTTNASTSVTFAATNVAMGAGVSVSGTGIQAGTTIVSASVVASVWTVVLSLAATASGTVLLTFDNNISVSGGACMLYPYLFVYGNNGLIQNCSAGNFNNWTSADSNANNAASTKIVKGMPLRGGTTSPSGLFWSTDSVIRVTYSPQTVGTSTLYWRYDLITGQSSIMSSQCVIEYDGIIYWVGVDRFLMYNGVVQEVENTQNLNWFFDGLNVSQRQKVWVSKIPRWGEIWWFYPRGTSTECNDAIIYNVREKTWYDAGLADGANRSAGYFSEVFRKPIWAGNVANSTGNYTLWVQESGSNQTYLNNVNAINSYFETNVLGSNMGLVGSAQGAGENLWTRLDRVEPDFQQAGTMSMVVTGKGFADDTDIESAPYNFDPTTLKIDLKEQRREMRLRFISNTVNGDYFMGRVVLNVETGDVRGTGNP